MTYYIYYQPATGNILSLTNEQDISFGNNFIEIEGEIYQKFFDDEYKIHEWAVLSSPNDEEIVELVKRISAVNDFESDNSIKQIEKVTVYSENAFIIEQNTQDGTWNVNTTLDNRNLIYYSQGGGYIDQQKEIYVIKEDNPNILLDTIIIEFKDLLTKNTYNVKIYNKDVAKRTDIGLICKQADEKYLHIVN